MSVDVDVEMVDVEMVDVDMMDVDTESYSLGGKQAKSDITCPPIRRLCPELLIEILSHMPDVLSMRNVILASSAFSRVYYLNQRRILLSIAETTYAENGVSLALPWLICKIRRVRMFAEGHIEGVVTLLNKFPESKALSRPTLSATNVALCKDLIRFHKHVSRVCQDVVANTLPFCPGSGGEPPVDRHLSRLERKRMMTAICRWDLFGALLVKFRRTSFARNQQKKPQICASELLNLYLSQFPDWEQEHVWCVFEYAFRRYWQLFDESVEWFHRNSTFGPDLRLDPSVNQAPTRLKESESKSFHYFVPLQSLFKI